MWPGVQVLVRPWAPHLNSLSLRLLVNKMRTSTQTLKGARQRGLSPGRRLLAGNGLLRSSRRRRGALRGAGIERAAAPATKGEAHHDARTAATHTSPPQRVAAGVPAPGDVPAGGRQRSGNEGETLRLCYLHMGTTGWHLRGPSSVPGHHRHLQLQKPKTRLQMSQAPGQTGRQAQPFREIRLTWRWALCNSHYKTSNGELSSQGGQQRECNMHSCPPVPRVRQLLPMGPGTASRRLCTWELPATAACAPVPPPSPAVTPPLLPVWMNGCWTSVQFNFLSVLVVFLFLNICYP
ncbi:T-cell surface glycoprotein CD8 alpha chain isoform 3-T3 [Glossophaga mutica]